MGQFTLWAKEVGGASEIQMHVRLREVTLATGTGSASAAGWSRAAGSPLPA